MKTTFDTDAILFSILKNSAVKNAINGNIYVGDGRPVDSRDEDIVVNTICLTADYHPQMGTSNVNIYVPDEEVTIGNRKQKKSNRVRLKALSEKAMDALRNARGAGVKLTVESWNTLAEPAISQHFVNMRISWNIQTD
jgi:hypothetical protein